MPVKSHLSPYLRLMRLHQPVGIWLLLWPCWWALALANGGLPPWGLMALFGAGAVLMRSAGCIINDIADRKYDIQVERTRTRPLASGELQVWQALTLLAFLLALSACIALKLGWVVMLWAALSLVPVVIYPFMKRISWWPQLFLGLTFNWGALMGWAAVRGTVELPAITLYLASLFWTLGYDTIYAHQDKKDDALIGVKSTALRLGNNTRTAIKGFYLVAILGWALTGFLNGSGIATFILLLCVQVHFGWQVYAVRFDDPASCRRIFISNTRLGLLVFLSFIAGHWQ